MKTRILAAATVLSAVVLNASGLEGSLNIESEGSTGLAVSEWASALPRNEKSSLEVPLGRPDWLPLNRGGSYVSGLLDAAQQDSLLATLGVDANVVEAAPRVKEGLEAVLHAKGSKFETLTLKSAAAFLERPQGHGTVFELKVAQAYAEQGHRVEFVKVGNKGTDLRVFPGASSRPMTMVQAKATASAIQSAQEGLLDALVFAGGNAGRPESLAQGKIAYEIPIPFDQAKDLVRDGQILESGKPSLDLIRTVLQKAESRAGQTGANAERIKAGLFEGELVLENVRIKPGPVTYGELVSDTKACVRALRTAAQEARATEIAKIAATPSAVGAATSKGKEAVTGAKANVEAGGTAREAGKLGKAGKVLTGVGVIGSVVQFHEGVQELREGKMVEGGGNLAGGAANGTSAIAALAGRAALSGSTMAIGAGIDGGIDLYKGIKEKNGEKTVVGSIKSGAAVAMGVGVAAAQPEVVVPAAIVYGGAVVGDLAYANRERLRHGLNSAAWGLYNHTPEFAKNNHLFQKSVGWFHGF